MRAPPTNESEILTLSQQQHTWDLEIGPDSRFLRDVCPSQTQIGTDGHCESSTPWVLAPLSEGIPG